MLVADFEKPIQIVSESAQELYYELLQALDYGETIPSVGTKSTIGSAWGTRERPTKELRYVTLVLENPRERLINAPIFFLESVLPRMLLTTLSDEKNVNALTFYNAKAKEFSDDGKTISTNYGYRMRHLENTDQIRLVINQFKEDAHTRRAVIHVHAVNDQDKKYCPCIDSLHFLLRNGALECHSFWRSENALTLLPINIFDFTMLQELIASEVGVAVGKYVHTVSSLHYYLEDHERLKANIASLISREKPEEMEQMPPHSLQQVSILKEFEMKLRENLDEWFSQTCLNKLSEYWQNIAKIIGYAIATKYKDEKLASEFIRCSPWKEVILNRMC